MIFIFVFFVLMYMVAIAAIIYLVFTRHSLKKDLDSITTNFDDCKESAAKAIELSRLKDIQNDIINKQESATKALDSKKSQDTVLDMKTNSYGRVGISYKMNSNVTHKIMINAQDIIDLVQKDGCQSSMKEIMGAITNIGEILGEKPLPCGLVTSVSVEEINSLQGQFPASILNKVHDLVKIIIDGSCGKDGMVDADMMMTIVKNVVASICEVSDANVKYQNDIVGISYTTNNELTRRILISANGIADAMTKEGCRTSMNEIMSLIKHSGEILGEVPLTCVLSKSIFGQEIVKALGGQVEVAVIEKIQNMVNTIIDGSCGKDGMVNVDTVMNIMKNVVSSLC